MTSGKRQSPLWLDMDFGEALARFAETDPKEVVEPEKKATAPSRTAAVKVKRRQKRLVQRPPKDADPR